MPRTNSVSFTIIKEGIFMNAVEKAFSQFSPLVPENNFGIYDVMLKFTTTNVDDKEITILMSAGALADDWYGSCDSVPENGALLHNLEISVPGKVVKLSREELGDFSFEELMRVIEGTWL